MTETQTSIEEILIRAAQELKADRKWRAIGLWKQALTIVDGDPDLDIIYSLDLRDRVAELLLSVGCNTQANELNDEIEESLNHIDDREEIEEFTTHIEQRRKKSAQQTAVPPIKIPRSPLRGYTHPQLRLTPAARPEIAKHYESELLDIFQNQTKSPLHVRQTEIYDGWDSSEESDLTVDDTTNLQPQSTTEDWAEDGDLHSTNLDTPEGRADEWFNRVIGWTHPFVKGKDESFQKAKIPGKKKRQVRVAILDTGFAYCTDSDKKKTSSFKDKVQKAESFLDDEDPGDGWKDDIGHGTAVAYQLAQVCPDAKLYICRIARKVNGKTDADRSAVVRALKRLTEDEKWKVDIINMSFGWEQQDDDVECALHEMQDKGVLLFASASNFGALGDNNILYPARSRHVISVDAADGLGEPATFNSSSVSGHTRERFSAPGWKVKGPANERVDGTSYASPIAVAIAALVLEFARQPPLGKDDEIESYLKKKDGIVRIFRLMSIQKGPEKLLFLCPWHLLRDKEGTYGGNGEPKSKRFYVAQQIIYQLRDEFLPRKGKIGQSLLMD